MDVVSPRELSQHLGCAIHVETVISTLGSETERLFAAGERLLS